MTDKLFFPDQPSRVTEDFAARLFVHHLSLAISYWEIGADKSITIDQAAAKLNDNAKRQALYKLIPILDDIYKEMES